MKKYQHLPCGTLRIGDQRARGVGFGNGRWRSIDPEQAGQPVRQYPGLSFRRPVTDEAFVGAWKQFAAEVYRIGKASGFYDTPAKSRKFNHAQKLLLMVSEIIEGHEGTRGAKWPGIPDDKLKHRPMLEAELADTIIRVMNYASHCGLDVAGAVVEKARFNATRGHRHGGKRF